MVSRSSGTKEAGDLVSHGHTLARNRRTGFSALTQALPHALCLVIARVMVRPTLTVANEAWIPVASLSAPPRRRLGPYWLPIQVQPDPTP